MDARREVKNMKLDLCQLSISYSGSDADKLKSPAAILQVKAKRVGVFHILETSHTLVAGFNARFRIYIRRVFFGIGRR